MGLEVEAGTFTRDVHRERVYHAASQGREDGEQPRIIANHDRKKEDDLSVEEVFAAIPVPPWRAQITVRGMVVSAVLGSLFCIITHKLNLTTGVIPSLNVSAGLLGFFFIRLWTGVLSKVGILHRPFTRQENTVIQTCVVACYGLAFSGGFGSYIVGMDQRTYNLTVSGDSKSAESPADVKNPSLGWLFGYMFTVSFLGLFAVVPLRKIMIIDYKLTYPSGTATAVLINSFHTPQGAEQAKKQIKYLGKYFSISAFWSFFKWFYSGGDNCGFDNFPSLGLKAFDNRFYFDFNLTYVGAGMICPHLVNCSILLGGILSWGLMWPLIGNRAGDWYPAKYKTGSNLEGINGYRVFVMIALILGDGLYNFLKITGITTRSIYLQYKKKQQLPINTEQNGMKELHIDEQIRNEVFMKDKIPNRVAFACYIALAAVSIGVIPKIFSQMKWYYVLTSYCVAPLFAFCNAYGDGLTDWSLASSYGKLALFIFATWAGSNGGVIVGLASCGVMMVIVSCAADLMQDFKTGYLTKSSPRSMFASQVLGTLMGCIIAPLTFWLYWKAYTIGDPTGEYKAPYALLYREMAIIGVQGFSSLPKYCLDLCYGFFAVAILINFIRDMVPSRVSRFIPIPMAMAIPFYIGVYFAIDMFLGTVIVFVWQQLNRKRADLYSAAVASGLLCGDGVWTLISSILSLAKVQPPICMYFYSRKAAKVLGL